MAYRKSLVIALRALRRNRLQTALTTLGMMIGVGTVLVMMAVGSGAERSITEQVRAAGMNVIVVSSGNYKMPQQWTSQGEAEEPTAWHPQGHGPQPKLLDGVYVPAIAARRCGASRPIPKATRSRSMRKARRTLAAWARRRRFRLRTPNAMRSLARASKRSRAAYTRMCP